MTVDEKFARLSGSIAVPIPGRPPIPEGALGSAAFYPPMPAHGRQGGTAGVCKRFFGHQLTSVSGLH